jgi:hypothetical protein
LMLLAAAVDAVGVGFSNDRCLLPFRRMVHDGVGAAAAAAAAAAVAKRC